MKKLFIILIALVSSNLISAQIKILFDATKAETAGNADWVIDSDLFNIGFGNGPASVGSGNESNPQRIPSPAQSGITGNTPETFWKGSLSSWGVDCVKKGYTVETLPYNVPITYGSNSNVQDLSNYKVFIVCEPNIVFSGAEKTAIMQFVQNGGGLFMISDHDISDRNGDGWDSPHIWNDLMGSNTIQNNPFGITFDYADFSETSTNIPSMPNDSLLHGPMGSVTEVKWSNGTSMTLDTLMNGSVKGVVYKTGSAFGSTGALMAYSRFGNGKVAAMGDSSPPDDGTGDSNDVLYNGWITDANGNHERLIMNATIWLATSSPLTTGITQFNSGKKTSVNVYPNPFNSTATIEINSEHSSKNLCIKIFDPIGNEVRSINNIFSKTLVIEKGDLVSGIYFVTVFDKNFPVAYAKLIIE